MSESEARDNASESEERYAAQRGHERQEIADRSEAKEKRKEHKR
jgi:hypothetical protein